MTTEDAIKVLKEQPKYLIENNCLVGEVSEIVAALDLAITALERDRWISVEERLPEEYETVLLINQIGDVRVGFFDGEYDGAYTMSGLRILVTHWRPLPEPPKEDKP